MQRLASPVLSALLRPHASVQRVFPCVSMSVLPSSMGVRALSTVDKPPVTFKLNDLRDNSGAWQNEKRVGRGKGSGYGKQSGRGMKGQRRLGGVRLGFEGGQTPLYRRVPKQYELKKTRFPGDLLPLNLGRLQLWIDTGRLNPSEVITLKQLHDSGIVGKIKTGVKLLGADASVLTSKLRIEVTEASESAIAAVEAAGGSVVTVYNSRLSLRAMLKPEKFAVKPKTPAPPPKSLPYYTNDDKRGYLSRLVQLNAAGAATA